MLTKIFILFLTFFFSSLLIAQTYEIKFDSLNASGWFGGDSRPGEQRNVAVAQSVFIEKPIILESFAFYFTSNFDSASSASGIGYEVTLRLHIRDSIGTIIETAEVVVPDTFSGGWVMWNEIDLNISEPSTLIFSTYVIGGYDSLQVNSGQGCNSDGNYANGERFGKYIVTDEDAEIWGDWSGHPWDSNFWLIGSEIPTSIKDNNFINHFSLSQNYPNPFNPTTIIKYSIPPAQNPLPGGARDGFVTLKIYDVLGNEISTLVNEEKSPGEYEIEFDAGTLSSGIYFYRLNTGQFAQTQQMILLK